MVEACPEDRQLERWSLMRFLVMGLIMLYRMIQIKLKGKEQGDDPKDTPYCDHPNLTKQMNTSNCLVGLVIGGVLFIQHEGVGFVIYFGTSAIMDNYTIYLVDKTQWCEWTTQVALYSMAVVTFLPCCIIAYYFQRSWYDRGSWLGKKTLFVVVMVLATIVSFIVRVILVYRLHWINVVHSLLQDNSYKVLIAILVPPIVDAVQTVTLISAALHPRTASAPLE